MTTRQPVMSADHPTLTYPSTRMCSDNTGLSPSALLIQQHRERRGGLNGVEGRWWNVGLHPPIRSPSLSWFFCYTHKTILS